jgi:hypothetical protein
MKSHLRLVWNSEWADLLYAEGTFIGAVVKSAFERAASPDLGPLPEEELEAFKRQVMNG